MHKTIPNLMRIASIGTHRLCNRSHVYANIALRLVKDKHDDGSLERGKVIELVFGS